jgi:hypothetical protein
VKGYFGLGGNTPGYPQSPTGQTTDEPNVSGLWLYDDGLLDPTNPNTNTYTAITVTDPGTGTTSTVVINPGDTAYSFATATAIGRFIYRTGIDNPAYTNYNKGSFFITSTSADGTKKDQFFKADGTKAEKFSDATIVKLTKTLDTDPNGAGYSVTGPGFENQAFDSWIWGPYIEFGWQTDPLFQIKYGFSWFTFANSFGKNISSIYYPSPTSFTDAYAFQSNDDSEIPRNFSSAMTIIIPGVAAYRLNPNNVTRSFTGGDPVEVLEHLSHDLRAYNYENRVVGRSNLLVLPSLEVGVALGLVATFVHLQTHTRNTIADRTTGEVVRVLTGMQTDNQWSYGGMAALDLNLNFGRTFLTTAFEYLYMTDIRYTLIDIENFINPGGKALSFSFGVRF